MAMAALDPSTTATTASMIESTSLLSYPLGLFCLYCIMSLNEYCYHRYFQHLGINKIDVSRSIRDFFGLPTYKGDGHVEHHRETLDDMMLEPLEKREHILDHDPFRGTAFNWPATFSMTVAITAQSLPVLMLLGWNVPLALVTILTAMMLHALAWNTIHPNMHGLPDVELHQGAPSGLLAGLRDSPAFVHLRVNHEGHHRTPGAHGNYNVCLPMMDHLFGTHVGEIPPAPKEPVATAA